jgi:hypothetical protein
MQITKIEKRKEIEEKNDYIVTLENQTQLTISATFYNEKWWIHSNDFEDIDGFIIFFRESMLKSPLFFDRLRFIVCNRENLVISCYGEDKLSTVYSRLSQGD